MSVQSRLEIEENCTNWAQTIEKSFSPDLVLFIAQSGFLFAKPIADYFNCELVDIVVARAGNRTKDRFRFIIKWIPTKLLLRIISSPLKYYYNEKKSERIVQITLRYQKAKQCQFRKILIVDDAVDTGWTVKAVLEKVKKDFPAAEIKIASYTVTDISKKRVQIDYWKYENEMILNPTSRKSPEYNHYIEEYHKWANCCIEKI